MEIKDKDSLLKLVNFTIQDKNFAKKEVLAIIREASDAFILQKGQILPQEYIFLFNNFQDVEIEPHNKITQHIKFFKDYYLKASIKEKYVLNNFIFALEILNGNAIEGLKEFIKRTFSFHMHSSAENEYYKVAIDFIKDYLNTSDEILISIVREAINNFFTFDKLTQRSLFIHFLAILWNNKIMFNNDIWLSVIEDLINLMNECIKEGFIEEQMYLHFFTYHIYGNNVQTIDAWRKFNELVEKPASKFYKKWGEEHNLIKAKKRVSTKKKKIGFLVDRIVFNSPWIIKYSLWEYLLKNDEFKKNYEIYVYSLNYLDKQLDNDKLVNQLKKLGIKFYSPQEEFLESGYYYSHLDKAIRIREKIIEDKIDYLIGGFGYDIPNFIFSNRSAPKQIFWSHGNCTSEIENIDVRISHFQQECKEFDWKIFNVPISERFLVGTKKEKETGFLIKKEMLKEFGEDTVFLGTIGRLVKIESEEYLKVISEIMKQNSNTIYLACGKGNIENVKKLMQKVGIDLNRVVFPGIVNAHIFGWIIDVWPDTFPLRQGQSKNEYIAKGGVVVFMDKYLNDTIRNWYKNYEFKPIAKDKAHYINLVNTFIKDNKIKQEISNINKKIFKDDTTDFIEKVLK